MDNSFFLCQERLFMRHYYDLLKFKRLIFSLIEMPIKTFCHRILSSNFAKFNWRRVGMSEVDMNKQKSDTMKLINDINNDYEYGVDILTTPPIIIFANSAWFLVIGCYIGLVFNIGFSCFYVFIAAWIVFTFLICYSYYRPHYVLKRGKRKKEDNHLRYFKEFDKEDKFTKTFGMIVSAWYIVSIFFVLKIILYKEASILISSILMGITLSIFLARIVYVIVFDCRKLRTSSNDSVTK